MDLIVLPFEISTVKRLKSFGINGWLTNWKQQYKSAMESFASKIKDEY